jgi:hypothetical protein
MTNKILLYEVILKPIWTYGLQLWGCAKPATMNLIQRFQSKTLRAIADAPWYVSNLTLHNDLKTPFVKNEILRLAKGYEAQTANHENKLIVELYTNGPVTRRLHRTWPQDFINQ